MQRCPGLRVSVRRTRYSPSRLQACLHMLTHPRLHLQYSLVVARPAMMAFNSYAEFLRGCSANRLCTEPAREATILKNINQLQEGFIQF
jgi:hypothetical protein